jgi:hypothetical protein
VKVVSAMTSAFPLPFKSLRTIKGGSGKPFIVGAMFTAGYFQQAERLAASCEKFGLPFELHEVPSVHASISMRGSGDPSFTKANFVHHLLTTHKKAVLYLDADCEFTAQPDMVTELVQSSCDFAIYNWFSDKYTDMFKPVEILADDSTLIKGRYFRFAGSVDWYTETQLMCSGLTQFYRNSRAARSLLRKWHKTIMDYPGCADDQCLDFAYNNLGKFSWRCWFLKARWLPKAYARMAFWIYANPVINHPEYPTQNDQFIRIKDPSGRRKQFYWPLIPKLQVTPLIPRDRIVDAKERLLCKVVDGRVIPAESTEQEFWI